MLVLEALSTPRNRTITFVFLAACCALTIAAVAVRVGDNPPGILLAFLAAAAFVLAFVHPWRTARQFRFLFYASFLSVVFFGVLAAGFEILMVPVFWAVVPEAVVSKLANAGALHGLLQGLGEAAFSVAVFGFPPAFLIGAVG